VLEHQKTRFKVIKMQVERLINLVENLFVLMQINESAAFEFGYVDLNALVNILVDEQRPLAEQQGLTCTFRPDASLSPVWADRHYLASAVSNLVINALSYTPPGGEVLVHTDKRDASAEISVEDNGIGISDTDLPHIFERFFRSNLAVNIDQHGTGLGLCIAEKIVKSHRGHFEVESELGKGSTFRICLPVASGET
jgi:signal transduction histidine kinase